MNKAQIFLIGMICALKPEHDLVKGLHHDSDIIRAFSSSATPLTKLDLFSTAPNGKSIFEYQEIWDSFPKIIELLSAQGESITPQDIATPLENGKTLLRMAADRQCLQQLFVPHIWKGKAEQMENVWYGHPQSERNKYDFEKSRRALAHAEGRTTREEQLERMNLLPERVRTAIRMGNIDEIKATMEKYGDRFRKEDLWMRDHTNETVLDSFAAWSNVDIWMKELQKHNDMPTVEDWLTSRAGSKTPLAKAADHGSAYKIFKPEYWHKNPEDMLRLYEHVPLEKRGLIHINETLNYIMNVNFGDRVDLDTMTSCDRLFATLDGPALRGIGGKTISVQPVMLEKIWKNIGQVRAQLQSSGEDLQLADLRRRTGFVEDSLIHVAIRHGQLDALLDIAKTTGDHLGFDDLTAKNARGQCPLDDLMAQGRIKTILQPGLWVGRVNDLVRVWKILPEPARRDIHFESIHSQANRLSLRQALHSGPRLDAA